MCDIYGRVALVIDKMVFNRIMHIMINSQFTYPRKFKFINGCIHRTVRSRVLQIHKQRLLGFQTELRASFLPWLGFCELHILEKRNKIVLYFKLRRNLFRRAQLKIRMHLLCWWFGTERVFNVRREPHRLELIHPSPILMQCFIVSYCYLLDTLSIFICHYMVSIQRVLLLFGLLTDRRVRPYTCIHWTNLRTAAIEETPTKPKSRETLFVFNIQHSRLIILQFYTEHGSDTVVFSTEFEDDWAPEIDVMDERILASSRWIFDSYSISQRPSTRNVSGFTYTFIGYINHRNNLVTNSHDSTT